jgi:hypothetical protein
LRAEHPSAAPEIARLESAVVSILRDDPAAVVDDVFLTQTIRIDRRLLRELLVELVARELLVFRAFWKCPNGLGVTMEAANAREFPSVIECSQCGQIHYFSDRDLEVRFLATDRLLEELRNSR